MVELQNQLVACDVALGQVDGIVDDGELQVKPLLVLLQPLQAASGERLVQPAPLGENQYAGGGRGREDVEEEEKGENFFHGVDGVNGGKWGGWVLPTANC